jgi:TPR repeat protein
VKHLRAQVALALLCSALATGPTAAQQQPVQGPDLPLPVPTTGAAANITLPTGPQRSFLGQGVPVDLAFGAFQRGYYITALREAMKRIESDRKDPVAMTLVGELYKDGLGVRRDLGEAARWYRLAAERGDPQGSFSLALAYLRGRGVPEDRKTAIVWLEKAAQSNHSGALYNLGLLAIDGDIQDFARAHEMFSRAAAIGNMDAAYALGLLYKEGRGVERDPARAADWFRKAADENIVAAEVDYAVMLFNGEGIPKDEAAAARYFTKAAASNNPVAANRLARLLVAGRGVQKNMVEAMKWHLLARAAGVPDEWLDSQLARLTPTERAAVDEAVRKYVSSIGPPPD